MINNLSKNKAVYPNNTIIVDGYSASGKGVLCKYIQSFNNVEKMCVDHTYHEIAFLSETNNIKKEVAQYYFKLKLNEMYENSLLSRNMNFRPYDDSSIFQSGNSFKYIKRLFEKDGLNVLKIIKNINPHFLIMSHFSAPFINFFFETLKNKVKFINIVRHPVYYYKHWIYLIDSIKKNDSRMHKFLNEYKGNLFFWFENLSEAIDMNSSERFISSFLYLNKLSLEKENSIEKKYLNQFKKISFENFVMNTDTLESEICDFLSLKPSKNTSKIKKKLNLNQNYFSEREFIRGKKGWKIHDNYETQLEYEKKLLKIQYNTDPKLFSNFLIECQKYENDNNFSCVKTSL